MPIRDLTTIHEKDAYAIAALALITSAACNKKDEDINNVPDKGAIRFINASTADRYNIYLDDYLFGNLFADDTAYFPNIVIGSHRVKAQQIDVTSTPILRQRVVIVQKDSVSNFIFP